MVALSDDFFVEENEVGQDGSEANVIKLFTAILEVCNKLERLSPASNYRLVERLQVRPEGRLLTLHKQ